MQKQAANKEKQAAKAAAKAAKAAAKAAKAAANQAAESEFLFLFLLYMNWLLRDLCCDTHMFVLNDVRTNKSSSTAGTE